MARNEIMMNEENTVMVFKSAIAELDAKPEKVKENPANQNNSDDIAYWGEDNLFPQDIIEELKKNSDLGSLLHLQARIMYAGGVDYMLVDPLTDQPLEKLKSVEINKFLKRNYQYPIQATEDFYKFLNFVPNFTLKDDKTKIKWLTGRPANWSRYSKMKAGKINQCFINSDWSQASGKDSEYTLKLPVIDAMTTEAEDFKESIKGSKDKSWVYCLSYPQGVLYYPIPNWWALKKSKWLELANKIPAFKLALMNNQISIKYHIQFPETHWEFICPGFANKTPEEKKQIKTDEVKKIVDLLQGEEKAGKSIVSGYQFDKINFKEYPGIKITPIDDKIKDGIYLEDSVEATIKLFTALGLDPAILGIVPGKGGSNRSGSDKREAIMMYTQLIQPHVDLVLRPYEFVADFNGWNTDTQKVKWFFKSAGTIPTLDTVTPSQRENIKPEAA